MRIFIPAFIAILLLSNCKSKTASKETENSKADTTAGTGSNTVDKAALLQQQSNTITSLLNNKDYTTLVTHFHPELGVRFSPYGHVDTANDVVMTREQWMKEVSAAKQSVINWGEYDGTGDPINMTLNEFIKRFVYPADFSKPEKFTINSITNPGNAENNIAEVYPGADFTDSHFSGFEKRYEGMDWRSLRLVFRELNGTYYLVGIVSDQWTI